jgi:NAD(P)H-dependent flavin oxidoreductase YrpB (nitropropane dioxygenase family)
MTPDTIHTPLNTLLKLQCPVMVAGMAGVTGPDLVAAASNAGGIGTIGAIGLSPEVLLCYPDTQRSEKIMIQIKQCF